MGRDLACVVTMSTGSESKISEFVDLNPATSNERSVIEYYVGRYLDRE